MAPKRVVLLGVVEVSVALLEKLYHCEDGFEVSSAQALPRVEESSIPVSVAQDQPVLPCPDMMIMD